MEVLLALIFGFIFGAVVGYGIRESISRRRHAAVAAREERRRRQISNPPGAIATPSRAGDKLLIESAPQPFANFGGKTMRGILASYQQRKFMLARAIGLESRLQACPRVARR
jgi:hypothetical protein